MNYHDARSITRVTRRTLLKTVCSAGAAIIAGPALAQQSNQQAARVKGPRVWLDMDQQEIDDAYDQSVWAPNQRHLSKWRAVWSEAIRARVKSERVAYGPTEIEKLDIYRTKQSGAPVRIFLRWRRLARWFGQRLGLSGRDVRHRRRALYRGRLHRLRPRPTAIS